MIRRKIDSKGRIVLSQDVLRMLRVKPGDCIDFSANEKNQIIVVGIKKEYTSLEMNALCNKYAKRKCKGCPLECEYKTK